MSCREASLPTRLYIWSGHALVLGMPANTGYHSHHALQISIGLSDNFRMRNRNEMVWREHRAALICADEPHEIEDSATPIVNLYLDPESNTARLICRRQSLAGFCSLDVGAIEPLLTQLRQTPHKDFSCEMASQWMQSVFKGLIEVQPSLPGMDVRIYHGLKLLNETPNHLISVTAVANAVGLSPGRFAHLFRAQVGLPVRRYLLWMRVRSAINFLSNNNSLTEAAHNSGFADSAHLSRTFRKMFGIAPSEIFQNSQFVQVNFCGD
jgi:AraC family transcriptional regulator